MPPSPKPLFVFPLGGPIIDGGVEDPEPEILLVLFEDSVSFVAVPFDENAPDKIITLLSVEDYLCIQKPS